LLLGPWCDLPSDTEIAEKAHHIVVVLRRRRSCAEDPVEQIRIGTFEQGFEAVKLTVVEACEGRFCKRAENEVALPGPTIPTAKQEPPAAYVRMIALSP